MRKQITTITLGILMIASVMAMYGGESMSFETNLTNPVYTVVGNSFNLSGLNVTFENGNITISPALNYKPDNFSLIFFDNITKEVERIVYRGGSSGSTRYVDRNVTVYVPEYINTTETITETITSDPETIVVEKGYELWQVLLGLVAGVGFGWFIFKKKKEKPEESNTAEDIIEMVDGEEKESMSEDLVDEVEREDKTDE